MFCAKMYSHPSIYKEIVFLEKSMYLKTIKEIVCIYLVKYSLVLGSDNKSRYVLSTECQ